MTGENDQEIPAVRSLPVTLCLVVGLPAGAVAAAPPFVEEHCAGCHDGATRAGGLDLAGLTFERGTLDKWVKVHDAVERGDMPPKRGKVAAAERAAFLSGLAARLTAAYAAGGKSRVRLRRLTRTEFQNTLQDLLALPRLDVTGLLPPDGRVAGYDKIAGALDLSPAHLEGYQEAVERALDAAVATRGTPPPAFKRRIYPAGLFKFGDNLVKGQFVLLKDGQPDPALPVRGGLESRTGYVGDEGPDLADRRKRLDAAVAAGSRSAVGLLNPNLAGYEAAVNVAPVYAGRYRIRLSLWRFHWNKGVPEPGRAPEAAVLRAHPEGKQQEGGRLLRAFTAPSLKSAEHEAVEWLDAHETLVFDPVSVPWTGLRVGQVAGRAGSHVGPGVALDWLEIEGPLNPSWPPEAHRRLFGDLPIKPLPAGSDRVPPRREAVRGTGGYLPNLHTDIPPADRHPPLETVQSPQPEADARRLLTAFLPRAFRRDVTPDEITPYLRLLRARLDANDCFEDAMRRVYVAVLTSPDFLFHRADDSPFTLASRLSYWLWNGPPDDALLTSARDGSLARPEGRRREVDRLLADPRSGRFVEDFTNQWLELDRLGETTPDPRLYPEYDPLLHEGWRRRRGRSWRNSSGTTCPSSPC